MKNKYVAIAIHGKYWIDLSKPCSKNNAEQFRGCEMKGETFKVVSENKFNKHRFKL